MLGVYPTVVWYSAALVGPQTIYGPWQPDIINFYFERNQLNLILQFGFSALSDQWVSHATNVSQMLRNIQR